METDRLTETSVRRGLATDRLGRRFVFFEETDSTNSRALELAKGGAEDGTLVLAETQTRGRGRMGRTWHSPMGTNLYFSLLLRPSGAARDAAWLGLAAGEAVARSLSEVSGLPASVKWPNDVQISGRKVAGLLLEQTVRGDAAEAVVLGIGVNVNEEAFPPDLMDSATSLFLQTGRPQDRMAVLRRLLEGLEECYSVFLRGEYTEIREKVMKVLGQKGERVRVRSGERSVEGVVDGLAADGALVLRLDDGRTASIHAGESTGLAPV